MVTVQPGILGQLFRLRPRPLVGSSSSKDLPLSRPRLQRLRLNRQEKKKHATATLHNPCPWQVLTSFPPKHTLKLILVTAVTTAAVRKPTSTWCRRKQWPGACLLPVMKAGFKTKGNEDLLGKREAKMSGQTIKVDGRTFDFTFNGINDGTNYEKLMDLHSSLTSRVRLSKRYRRGNPETKQSDLATYHVALHQILNVHTYEPVEGIDPADHPEFHTHNAYFLMLVKEESLPHVFPGHTVEASARATTWFVPRLGGHKADSKALSIYRAARSSRTSALHASGPTACQTI